MRINRSEAPIDAQQLVQQTKGLVVSANEHYDRLATSRSDSATNLLTQVLRFLQDKQGKKRNPDSKDN